MLKIRGKCGRPNASGVLIKPKLCEKQEKSSRGRGHGGAAAGLPLRGCPRAQGWGTRPRCPSLGSPLTPKGPREVYNSKSEINIPIIKVTPPHQSPSPDSRNHPSAHAADGAHRPGPGQDHAPRPVGGGALEWPRKGGPQEWPPRRTCLASRRICLWTHSRAVETSEAMALPRAVQRGWGTHSQAVLVSKAHSRPGVHLLRSLRGPGKAKQVSRFMAGEVRALLLEENLNPPAQPAGSSSDCSFRLTGGRGGCAPSSPRPAPG